MVKPECRWDFDDLPGFQPGYEGGEKTFERYKWNTAGTYTVGLSVVSCPGRDTMYKQVTVIDPASAPVAGFYASKTRVPVNETANLFDTSAQGPNAWRWEVSPATAVWTAAKTATPSLYFTAAGTYEVKLVVSNAIGADSVVKTAYIDVTEYCEPAVALLGNDIGISRVAIGSINQVSEIGLQRYTSYFSKVAPVQLRIGRNAQITIERLTNTDPMSRKAWADWNQDGQFDETRELVVVETAAKTLSFTGQFTVPADAKEGLTVLRVGAFFGSGTPCAANMGEYEDYPVFVTLPPSAVPVVTISGKQTDSIQVFTSLYRCRRYRC